MCEPTRFRMTTWPDDIQDFPSAFVDHLSLYRELLLAASFTSPDPGLHCSKLPNNLALGLAEI
jgi:hypothetical protein